MTDEKKPPQGAESLVDGLRVGSPGSNLRLLMDVVKPSEPLWAAVRSARGANQPALMAELEVLATAYDALVARVQPAVVFKAH